jgi:pantetheine-phosphate adenylyltransferase
MDAITSNTLAIYPGTFDPVTLGHVEIAKRATRLFSKVILGVAKQTGKNAMFTFSERIALAEEVFKDIPNIQVIGFDGLLVDFLIKQGSLILVRGIRNSTDFAYEHQLASMNARLLPGLDSVFLTPSENVLPISGTLVRQIASLGGDVDQFVPALVSQALKEKQKDK